eukprot:CAMPEP_0185567012 /NCGR_PEP_ID=MMETSP0434-20130131/410_1 /TAXON_ID=626734 ORGANISM="Favella taraikaensis, Strain Fe Narragansett Bay" /NCGR_SAMPLE_ID=MMETSP0434 /ASSEMBLY_ACC=CAM_ASM_000379 /LENGTH=154 /DNA_ID=CAMNT_0028181117 /DNA_START=428 /DNA_END=892 /DNA_ORIENTATION=-
MECEVHIIGSTVGSRKGVKAWILPEVAVRVAILEQQAREGFRCVDQNEGNWQAPGLDFDGPVAESDYSDDVAEAATHDHHAFLRPRILLKPLVDRLSVLVGVIVQALDFVKRHIGHEVDEGENADEQDHNESLENPLAARTHLREGFLAKLVFE